MVNNLVSGANKLVSGGNELLSDGYDWKHKDLLCCDNHLVSWGPWTLLQGQTKVATLKSAYTSLIIGPRGYGYKANL